MTGANLRESGMNFVVGAGKTIGSGTPTLIRMLVADGVRNLDRDRTTMMRIACSGSTEALSWAMRSAHEGG